ncbi:hypothetical protein HK405_000703, partial [Cladochytrium tenue]
RVNLLQGDPESLLPIRGATGGRARHADSYSKPDRHPAAARSNARDATLAADADDDGEADVDPTDADADGPFEAAPKRTQSAPRDEAGSDVGRQDSAPSNRDEFLDRPARPLNFWDHAGLPHVVGGIDLGAATATAPCVDGSALAPQPHSPPQPGTWLAVTRDGRFGFVTNVREAPPPPPASAQTAGVDDTSPPPPPPPTRGQLVSDFVSPPPAADAPAQRGPAVAAATTLAERPGLSGFNLVLGSLADAAGPVACSNRRAQHRPPVHGEGEGGSEVAATGGGTLARLAPRVPVAVSNAALEEALVGAQLWPKVREGTRKLDGLVRRWADEAAAAGADGGASWIDREDVVEDLLATLRDKVPRSEGPDDEPATPGWNPAAERLLLPLCIEPVAGQPRVYATRAHTVVLVDRAGQARVVEVTRSLASDAEDGDEDTKRRVQLRETRVEVRFDVVLAQPVATAAS